MDMTYQNAALAAGLAATLPPGFQWGSDAMEQFNFGKERAVDAMRAALANPWKRIREEPPSKGEMFVWAYQRTGGKWAIGLGYWNVSGGWSDAYGDRTAPSEATHWAPMYAPPQS
jgi:hypothetical protein